MTKGKQQMTAISTYVTDTDKYFKYLKYQKSTRKRQSSKKKQANDSKKQFIGEKGHIQRCSISLVIRKVKNKTKKSIMLNPSDRRKFKSVNIQCWQVWGQ